MEVRYSDAHAWSEVWLNQRWERVDPTGAIRPERIELGMEALLALLENEDDQFSTGQLADYLAPKGINKLLREWQEQIDNIGYQWNKWIVNYDFDKQKELLEELGFKHQNSLYSLMLILFISIGGFLLFYFWQLIPKTTPLDESQKLYLQFIARFKRHQLIKQPADTPNDFAQKASEQFPHLSVDIQQITDQYLSIRYGKPKNNAAKQFKQSVKQFKIRSSN